MQVVRLDKLIPTIFKDFSRNQIQRMIDEELVFVNKKTEKPSYKVNWGDIISITC